MIVGLTGEVLRVEQTSMEIDVSGVIYRVFLSIQSSSRFAPGKATVLISQIIKEDSHQLFGFYEQSERQLFERLLKINGVGPKAAMAICSTHTPEEFNAILASKDVNSLKKAPGIGPKAAARILVELEPDELVTQPTFNQEALEALLVLGFNKEKAQKVLQKCSAVSTSDLVKEALQRLS